MVLSLSTTRVVFPLFFLLLGNYVKAREYTIKADRICKFRKGKTLQDNILKVIKLGSGSTDFVAQCTTKCDKNELCKGFQLLGRQCSLVINDIKGFKTSIDNNKNNNNNKNKRRLAEPEDQNEEDRENKNNDKENKNNDKENKNNDKEDKNTDIGNKEDKNTDIENKEDKNTDIENKEDKNTDKENKENKNTEIEKKNTDKEGISKSNPNDESKSKNRTYTCGILAKTASPTVSSPTVSPSVSILPTELHSKVFEFNEDTRCKAPKGDNKKQDVYQNFSREECDNACGHAKKCKSYSWNSNLSECILFRFRTKELRENKIGSVCARVPKKTKAPVSPTPYPTTSPTEKLKCVISAELKFPFVFGSAPYYGNHADWLEVSKKNYKNDYKCSSYYAAVNDLPGWCTYKNLNKFEEEGSGDSAYVQNLEDAYYETYYLEQTERLDSEFVKIKDAYDHVTIIESFHYLFAEDYYPDDKDWYDHMMVPTLTIRNLSNDKQAAIGKSLQHPAKKNVSTHIEENGSWVGNENYKGNIRVEIHCNKFCRCEQKEYSESGGFYDY